MMRSIAVLPLLAALGAAPALGQDKLLPAKPPSLAQLDSKEEGSKKGKIKAVIDAALREAYRACQATPRSAQAWGEYGMTLFANTLVTASVDAFRNAHTLAPEQYRWTFLLAQALLESGGDSAEVLALAKIAAGQKPDSADIQYLLARAYEASGEPDKALEALYKAVEYDAEALAVNFMLGQLLLAQRRYQESKPYLLKAMKLGPASAAVRASLIKLSNFVAVDKGLIPSAEAANIEVPVSYGGEILQEVGARNRLPDHMTRQARQALLKQDWPGAVHWFGLLEKHYDLADSGMADYGLALTGLQKYDEAEKIYRRLVKKNPKSDQYRLSLADLLFMNRHLEAAKHYQWLLERSKSDAYKAEALQGLGRIEASNKNLYKGLKLMRRAVELKPESGDIHVDLVRIYAELKDFDRAYYHLDQAERLGTKVDPQFKRMLDMAKRQSSSQQGIFP